MVFVYMANLTIIDTMHHISYARCIFTGKSIFKFNPKDKRDKTRRLVFSQNR